MSMAGRDGTDPDSILSDSGMASGTDAGEPDEERLLAALERDAGSLPPADPELVRAAEDERPLPARGGVPDDGLTPRFVAPEAD
jgi:hypothetical protein